VASARRLLAEMPGAILGEAHAGNVSVVWAAGASAPIDVHRTSSQLGVIVGYAVDDAGQHVGAHQLTSDWLHIEAGLQTYDGYYVGIAFDENAGLSIGADALGLFPLYYAEPCDGVLVVSTAPRALSCHSGFVRRIDRFALAGILMTNGMVDNRPLLAGTRRLALGHRLRARPGATVREVEVFRVIEPSAAPRETMDEMRVRISHELSCTITRHRPAGDDTLLMLSGGLDSRLIAGCLAELGIPTRAVSLGQRADHEIRAAEAVARCLRMPYENVRAESEPPAFVLEVRRSARLSGLSAAPSGDDLATGLGAAATRAQYAWSGVPFDWLFEPVSRHSGFDIGRGTWSFNEMVGHMNAWGIPLAHLSKLLGGDGPDLCAEVMRSIERRCTSGPLPIDRQSALLKWEQRVRSHLAHTLHRISFVAWPLMVATDRRLFSALYWLPHEAYPGRRLEKDILLAHRPDLAAIGLDANSFRFDPLGGVGDGRLRRMAKSLVRRARRAIQPFAPSLDTRRYERLFNVDHPRWIAVRQDAERLRPAVEQILDPAALAQVWPGPRRRLRSRKPIEHGAAIRLLVGLAYALDG
jgi:asparagine synthase (glutamine-hydrolysing)